MDNRDRVIAIERDILRFAGQRVVANPKLFGMVIDAIDKHIGKPARLEWLRRLSGNPGLQSSNDLAEHIKFGLLMWGNPAFDENTQKWYIGNSDFAGDCNAILVSLGQLKLGI